MPVGVQVRFAAKPQDRLAQRLSQPTSGVLTEADRRRLFFTRGPPGIQAITINQAFSPYGEVGTHSPTSCCVLSCSVHAPHVCPCLVWYGLRDGCNFA